MELKDLKTLFDEGTDNYLIICVLIDGQYHNVIDICHVCKPGCVNWAVRSRISNIKARIIPVGFTIEGKKDDNKCHKYRISKIEQIEMAIA